MSASAASLSISRVASFYKATVGKKVVMAVTGAILYGFLIGHLLGNLQVYLGPEALNAYARNLRAMPALPWAVRAGLAVAVLAHMVAAFQLWRWNRAARPERYRSLRAVESSYASRTMLLSGPVIAVFVVYHLMHLTFGNAHPDFDYDLDVYRNVIGAFQNTPVAMFYVASMLLIGLHLRHGVWSMFQSAGISHPRYTPWIRRLADVSAALLVAGNVSIPLAILAGYLK